MVADLIRAVDPEDPAVERRLAAASQAEPAALEKLGKGLRVAPGPEPVQEVRQVAAEPEEPELTASPILPAVTVA